MVTVTGTFLRPDDTPCTGAVTFAVYVAASDTTPDDRVVTPAPVVVRLYDTGSFTVDLVASDDDGWQTDGPMPYTIGINVTGQRAYNYAAYINDPGPYDIGELVVLDWPPNVANIPNQGDAATVDAGTTTTGDAGTDAAVVNSGTTSAAVFDFTIPKGDQGDKGDPGDPGEVSQAELEAYAAARATVGNLLTDNQASVETDLTGISASTSTIARVADTSGHGSYAVEVTAISAYGGINVGFGTTQSSSTSGSIPIAPDLPYTVSAKVWSSTITRNAKAYLRWWQANGTTQVGDTVQSDNVVLSPTPKTVALTAVAPAGAAFASIQIAGGTPNSTQAGEKFRIDAISIHAGAGGNWAMPGTPITGLGTRITRPNVDDRLVEQWNGAAWSVVDYDSGWRNMAASLVNGWTAPGANSINLRRVGVDVHLRIGYIGGTAATADLFVALPSGFRSQITCVFSGITSGNNSAGIVYNGAGNISTSVRTSTLYAEIIYATSDAVPTSLPGTLVTPAPQ